MADVTLDELRGRLGEEGLVLLDVRMPQEFEGSAGAPCDPRQGHIPGARSLPLDRLVRCRSADEVRALVGLAPGTEIIAYCHSGNRSGFAAQVLAAAGYEARNFVGSWHEWSRDPELPSAAS
ncbi:MAG: rhodanese-like domain-containing protein [Gaiellaceae bacterium]